MVTGGAGAIGGAIVARFLSDGARVAILDLRLEAGLAKVRELAAAGLVTEGRVTCHEVDVRSREKCREVVTQIVAAWGGVHHLVNCVAYFGSEGLQATEADWDTTMRWSWHLLNTGPSLVSVSRVNVAGSCFMVQAVVEHMQAYSGTENCSVTNMSSISAHQTQPNRLELSTGLREISQCPEEAPTSIY